MLVATARNKEPSSARSEMLVAKPATALVNPVEQETVLEFNFEPIQQSYIFIFK